ncbi:unnamed protein product, partial [Protopolystoma xenopodis]
SYPLCSCRPCPNLLLFPLLLPVPLHWPDVVLTVMDGLMPCASLCLSHRTSLGQKRLSTGQSMRDDHLPSRAEEPGAFNE